MLEDFDIRQEFFVQPYLFEPEFTDQELSQLYVICSTALSRMHLLERPEAGLNGL